MNVITMSSILVPPDRQRQEHDEEKLQELIASIQGPQGLMHPPVTRQNAEGRIVLVAGERRLRACREIAELGGRIVYGGEACMPGHIPVNDIGELTPLEAEEAELEENLRRVDLTWQEQASAEAKLVALRGKQAAAAGRPVPSTLDIAKELNPDASQYDGHAVAQSVLLARNLHRPEVAGAKSVKEAVKALKRTEENERNAKVADALGKDFLGSKHRVVNWDCFEWMAQQAGGEFDVICTDPPYGMGADEFGDSGGGTAGEHFYSDSSGIVEEIITVLPKELHRLTKADAHAYIFCDIDWFHAWRAAMADAGWKVFRTPLIWHKPGAFRAPWPQQGPQRKYECILYAVKGGLLCTSLAPDVVTVNPDANLGHNAQKPVALYKDLLKRSVRPGMKVFDPFCGTGPVFPAAHELSAIAVGVEKDAAAYGIAAKRIIDLGGMGA